MTQSLIQSLRYTVVGDGTSDRALMPILRWLLLQSGTSLPLSANWADPQRLRVKTSKLADRLPLALSLYPCDLLFVHRDAEKEAAETRRSEIAEAASQCAAPPTVCVVPVRMTEAWLLLDEAAIRRAADNPNGKAKLEMPSLKEMEALPDPKEKLNTMLRTACELSGRRLNQFKRDEARRRVQVADFVQDFSPLLQLPAFRQLQEEAYALMAKQGWQ